VSNWAQPGGQCQHNLHYWVNDDWLGIGPGAHSHLAGARWWNVKHPRSYSQKLTAGELPIDQREVLTPPQIRMEQVMLGLRTASGLDLAAVDGLDDQVIVKLASDGLLDEAALAGGRLVVSTRGRLFADAIVRDLLG
jgi:oxygen-independent coproporphyrinogen-3 oxidase